MGYARRTRQAQPASPSSPMTETPTLDQSNLAVQDGLTQQEMSSTPLLDAVWAMELATGEDFSDVSFERGAGPGSRGATDGETVWLSEESPEVIGEELAHVLQFRRRGAGENTVDGGTRDAAELEARAAGRALADGRELPTLAAAPTAKLHRSSEGAGTPESAEATAAALTADASTRLATLEAVLETAVGVDGFWALSDVLHGSPLAAEWATAHPGESLQQRLAACVATVGARTTEYLWSVAELGEAPLHLQVSMQIGLVIDGIDNPAEAVLLAERAASPAEWAPVWELLAHRFERLDSEVQTRLDAFNHRMGIDTSDVEGTRDAAIAHLVTILLQHAEVFADAPADLEADIVQWASTVTLETRDAAAAHSAVIYEAYQLTNDASLLALIRNPSAGLTAAVQANTGAETAEAAQADATQAEALTDCIESESTSLFADADAVIAKLQAASGPARIAVLAEKLDGDERAAFIAPECPTGHFADLFEKAFSAWTAELTAAGIDEEKLGQARALFLHGASAGAGYTALSTLTYDPPTWFVCSVVDEAIEALTPADAAQVRTDRGLLSAFGKAFPDHQSMLLERIGSDTSELEAGAELPSLEEAEGEVASSTDYWAARLSEASSANVALLLEVESAARASTDPQAFRLALAPHVHTNNAVATTWPEFGYAYEKGQAPDTTQAIERQERSGLLTKDTAALVPALSGEALIEWSTLPEIREIQAGVLDAAIAEYHRTGDVAVLEGARAQMLAAAAGWRLDVRPDVMTDIGDASWTEETRLQVINALRDKLTTDPVVIQAVETVRGAELASTELETLGMVGDLETAAFEADNFGILGGTDAAHSVREAADRVGGEGNRALEDGVITEQESADIATETADLERRNGDLAEQRDIALKAVNSLALIVATAVAGPAGFSGVSAIIAATLTELAASGAEAAVMGSGRVSELEFVTAVTKAAVMSVAGEVGGALGSAAGTYAGRANIASRVPASLAKEGALIQSVLDTATEEMTKGLVDYTAEQFFEKDPFDKPLADLAGIATSTAKGMAIDELVSMVTDSIASGDLEGMAGTARDAGDISGFEELAGQVAGGVAKTALGLMEEGVNGTLSVDPTLMSLDLLHILVRGLGKASAQASVKASIEAGDYEGAAEAIGLTGKTDHGVAIVRDLHEKNLYGQDALDHVENLLLTGVNDAARADVAFLTSLGIDSEAARAEWFAAGPAFETVEAAREAATAQAN